MLFLAFKRIKYKLYYDKYKINQQFNEIQNMKYFEMKNLKNITKTTINLINIFLNNNNNLLQNNFYQLANFQIFSKKK